MLNAALASDPSGCSGPFCCGNYDVALEPGPILPVQSAAHRLISRLQGLPILSFLIRNVFVAAVAPKMAAGCSPEVTLVSVHRATPSWSEDVKRIKDPKPSSYRMNGERVKTRAVLTRQRALPAA